MHRNMLEVDILSLVLLDIEFVKRLGLSSSEQERIPILLIVFGDSETVQN